MTDDCREFRAAMAGGGIVIDAEIIPDGRLHRVHAEGDGPRSKNAWYVLHADLTPCGRFGSWRLGISQGWVSARAVSLTDEQRADEARRLAALRVGREAQRSHLEREAGRRARYIWERSRLAPGDHPYLLRKGVDAHGLRIHGQALTVPLYDALGTLHSLQFITPGGEKRFLTHGRVRGCFCGLGLVGNSEAGIRTRLWIAEGYATGATVRELTGEPVAVAFNAGNLEAVALAIRGRLPDAQIVMAADNDRWTPGNPGLTKAVDAARAVGGQVSVPYFADIGGRPTDWNDLYRLRGAGEARSRLLRAA